jgi:hypothetical protein
MTTETYASTIYQWISETVYSAGTLVAEPKQQYVIYRLNYPGTPLEMPIEDKLLNRFRNQFAGEDEAFAEALIDDYARGLAEEDVK